MSRDELADRLLRDDVEPDRRLVQIDDSRVVQQRRREIAAHALAERELAHRRVAGSRSMLEHLDELVQVAPVAIAAGCRRSRRSSSNDSISGRSHQSWLRWPKTTPMLRALSLRCFRGDEPGDPHLAGGRHEDAGEHLDRRGLAGAVRADVADQLAGLEREGHAVDRDPLLVFAREEGAQRAERSRRALASCERPCAGRALLRSAGHGDSPLRISSPVIVTVSNEYGSGALAIAARAAESWDTTTSTEQLPVVVAKRLRISPEEVEASEDSPRSLGERLIDSLERATPELAEPRRHAAVRRGACCGPSPAVREYASAGRCVIVGRGASAILGERPDVLRVFMHAPRDWRIAHVVKTYDVSLEIAAGRGRRVDRMRAAYIHHWYGVDVRRSGNYDLCIDTSRSRPRAELSRRSCGRASASREADCTAIPRPSLFARSLSRLSPAVGRLAGFQPRDLDAVYGDGIFRRARWPASPHAAALDLGILGASRAIPVLLLSPLAGVVADHLPRRRVLIVTNTTMALAALLLALLATAHRLDLARPGR